MERRVITTDRRIIGTHHILASQIYAHKLTTHA